MSHFLFDSVNSTSVHLTTPQGGSSSLAEENVPTRDPLHRFCLLLSGRTGSEELYDDLPVTVVCLVTVRVVCTNSTCLSIGGRVTWVFPRHQVPGVVHRPNILCPLNGYLSPSYLVFFGYSKSRSFGPNLGSKL